MVILVCFPSSGMTDIDLIDFTRAQQGNQPDYIGSDLSGEDDRS